MSTFKPANLVLMSQGIGGRNKIWYYSDTGAIGDISEVAGYFGTANQYGMDTGDLVFINANDGYTTRVVRGMAMSVVQDTGTTQGTAGASIVVGDTS